LYIIYSLSIKIFIFAIFTIILSYNCPETIKTLLLMIIRILIIFYFPILILCFKNFSPYKLLSINDNRWLWINYIASMQWWIFYIFALFFFYIMTTCKDSHLMTYNIAIMSLWFIQLIILNTILFYLDFNLMQLLLTLSSTKSASFLATNSI